MHTILNFLQEVRGELMKVAWPTRNQVVQSTIAVILLTIVVAAFLGGLDYVFSYVLKNFIIR